MKVKETATPRHAEHRQSAIYLATLLTVFVAWEFLSHLLMHRMEMTTYHVLSALVETGLAFLMVAVAVRILNRQNRELERQIVLRETMTQMLVHDLRNPLTGLLFALRTLQRKPPPQVVEETLDISLDSASRLRDLIDDILDIARLEELTNALDIEVTEGLEETLKSVVAETIRIADQKQLSTEILLPPELPSMALDVRRFRRVLENLLSNAIKHTPTKGQIRLEITLDSGSLIGEVSDNGPGIPPQYRKRIFDKFEMVGPSKRSSSGLGLTFCRLVVEGHGGRIWVEESPEGGCSFKFRIPISINSEA